MSKPDWTALADRYGAQPAEYNGELFEDQNWICPKCGSIGYEPWCEGADECRECAQKEIKQQKAQWDYDDELRRTGEALHHAVDLLTLARAHQDAGAAEDGQATVALAWMVSAVGLLVFFTIVTIAAFGAACIDGAWLAPFAGLGVR